VKVRISLPVEISQSLRVLSSLPDRAYLPSGVMATKITTPVCPVKVRISLPVEISQSLRVLSSLPDRTYWPSGEKTMERTTAVCPSCTNISGPCLLPAGASFSSAKAEDELTDSMAITPNQAANKRHKLFNLNIVPPFIYDHYIYLSGKNDFTDFSNSPI
jgi:hypothetical protein